VALAQANMSTGKPELGRDLYAEAQKDVPGHAPAMLGEALMKASSGDRAGAMATVESVIAKNPNLVEAWLLKGDLAGLDGQSENAIAAYRQSLEGRPRQLAAPIRFATSLIQQGKTQEAGQQIEEMKKL